jgi:hypothetical protein
LIYHISHTYYVYEEVKGTGEERRGEERSGEERRGEERRGEERRGEDTHRCRIKTQERT